MFVFEKGKKIIYISRHLEWCKGTLIKDYPDKQICSVMNTVSGGYYTIQYENIREYISKADRDSLRAKRKKQMEERARMKEEITSSARKPETFERHRQNKSKNKKRNKRGKK